MSSPRRAVEEALRSERVVVFSKSYCPYSHRAKDTLAKHRIKIHAVELDKRADGGEIQDALEEMTGARTVPRVFIDGKFVGGATETGELDASGRLHEMLVQKGITQA
jgi:glutaredoxin 3